MMYLEVQVRWTDQYGNGSDEVVTIRMRGPQDRPVYNLMMGGLRDQLDKLRSQSEISVRESKARCSRCDDYK